ncbi:uncharacterized protein GGS25DRAFT_521889 [Hypoxylon fragiforme]|uniref:uncharacterized protein n=1 Tax=Hypoxylon fragiforme TaxID=63214 RepID=UPI0020C6DF0A|nr:uncharacterized protein GGS25DRAFT_521889 [Hypoxylon fragiforme]KAI2608717.1 hypothetical protein GGS25DRAFT_521889 [Hypoxylon fragiforme]
MPYRNGKDSTIWVNGMKLGKGAPHDPEFRKRIGTARRSLGSGTIADPMVIWPTPGPKRSAEVTQAIEHIVHQVAKRCGLPYAWIAADGHSYSTTAWTMDGRIMSHDDHHITVRMGMSPSICNIQGHIYVICEDNDVKKRPLRVMEEGERGIVGGKNPQFWIWGGYPSNLPPSGVKYPKSPFEIVPNSILEFQMEVKRKEEEADYLRKQAMNPPY